MNQTRLLVVGSYATGLVMQTERLPLRGETLIGWGFRAVHGGKGSNQAVQAARLGARTAFLGCIGRDGYGDRFETLLREEAISADAVTRHETLPTGVGFIIVDRSGQNLITVDPGANHAITPETLERHHSLFEQADVVLAQLEIRRDTALAAMRIGRASGAITILNPAPAVDLSDLDLSTIDYLTPNETEARVCGGQVDDDVTTAIRRLRELGVKNVLLTVGERGCLWYGPSDEPTTIPGFKVTPVDTVGAGDAFSAALAVALGEGRSVVEAARFANAAAALSVTKPDTIPSYHRRDEVDAFLRSRS